MWKFRSPLYSALNIPLNMLFSVHSACYMLMLFNLKEDEEERVCPVPLILHFVSPDIILAAEPDCETFNPFPFLFFTMIFMKYVKNSLVYDFLYLFIKHFFVLSISFKIFASFRIWNVGYGYGTIALRSVLDSTDMVDIH